MRAGGGEQTVPSGMVWTSDTDILFCNTCRTQYRRADYLTAHIPLCKGEGRIRQVFNRATSIPHSVIGREEALVYRYADTQPP